MSKYRWTGHKELTGSNDSGEGIISRDEVLGYFGERLQSAQEAYEKFVKEGVEEVYKELEAEERASPIKDIDCLIRMVAKYYNVEKAEILETRKNTVRQARNVLVYLVKYLRLNGKQIGRMWA
ncbi:MAG: hypothetical protein KKD05_03845 [Candidatus Omnitrophica bacterium]|nr:hypothetical protein [Candidatus Omnitrophota bacterium]